MHVSHVNFCYKSNGYIEYLFITKNNLLNYPDNLFNISKS